MTGASRPDEDVTGGNNNVLRPLVDRWMPDWVAVIRSATTPSSEESVACNVHVLADSNLSEVEPSAHDVSSVDRMEKLRELDTRLLAEFTGWIERCQSIETILYRARDQMDQAVVRLTSTGESVPDDSNRQLTALQESYRNFAMTVALQEQKLSFATYKVSSIQRQRAGILAEMSSVSQNPSHDLPNSRQEDLNMAGMGTVRKAA